MIFDNATDFVAHIISRADHSTDVIVGLGVTSPRGCDGREFTSCGENHITGYFYNEESGFHDHFIIETNFWNQISGERTIRRIREVTDLFYYH